MADDFSLPKGDEAGGEQEVTRSVTDLRPLGRKNTDNNIVCAIWNHALRSQVARLACPLQRGLVAGRRLLQHVPDLDVAARIVGGPMNAIRLPMLVLFDFMAAFPSVALAWIWTVLGAMGVHPGFCEVIAGLCHLNCSLLSGARGHTFLCWIAAGVLHGVFPERYEVCAGHGPVAPRDQADGR